MVFCWVLVAALLLGLSFWGLAAAAVDPVAGFLGALWDLLGFLVGWGLLEDLGLERSREVSSLDQLEIGLWADLQVEISFLVACT